MTDTARSPTAASRPTRPPRLAPCSPTLDRELDEIDLLDQPGQDRGRPSRAEAASRPRSSSWPQRRGRCAPKERRRPRNPSSLPLTRRAALMEAQVDVLEGKRRALARHRDAIAALRRPPLGADRASRAPPASATGRRPAGDPIGGLPPAVSRDRPDRPGGPAPRDRAADARRAGADPDEHRAPGADRGAADRRRSRQASGEVRQLIAMVQRTLDATKTFIFDVRPMVLDDLGLVPTLRRAARDRGRRVGSPSTSNPWADRRLPMDIESAVFRMLDEALAAYLGASPIGSWCTSTGRTARGARGRRAFGRDDRRRRAAPGGPDR